MEKLIQEEYLDDGWKLCVVCILLNQTDNKQVRPVLSSLFNYISSPEDAVKSDPLKIAKIIQSTGFQNIKSNRIIALSTKWIEGFSDVKELPGIGKYGIESWKIFVERNFDFFPSDKKLALFLESGGPARIERKISK